MSLRFWLPPPRRGAKSAGRGAGQGWRRATKAVRATAVICVVYILICWWGFFFSFNDWERV